MKTNIEKTIVIENVDVDMAFGLDENGVVQYIDFVTNCPECEMPEVQRRFVAIDEDSLHEMLEYEEQDYFDIEDDDEYDFEEDDDEEEYEECQCPACIKKRIQDKKHYS